MADPYSSPEPSQAVANARSAFIVPVVSLVAVLLLIIGVAAVVSGDGDTQVEVDPLSLLQGAPDAAREAGSARMSMHIDMGGGEGMSMSMDGEGLVDFVTGAGSFSMSGFGASFEMLTDGTTLWMRIPEMGRPAGISQEWLAMPATGFGQSSPMGMGGAAAAGYLDALRGMGGDFEELGRREVNGVDANGYRVTVDLASAMEQVPDEQRAQAEAGLEQLRAMGSTSMPMEVWITDDGLPVRIKMDMTGAGLFEMNMQIDFTDFGVDVDIEPPPADDVYQVDDPSQIGELFGGTEPVSGTEVVEVSPVYEG